MLYTTHHFPIARRCHISQLISPEDYLPPASLVLTPHLSDRLMRNRNIAASLRAPNTTTMVLLPLINSDDVSVLEALDIPEPGLKKRT
jgi:hypothetical protein